MTQLNTILLKWIKFLGKNFFSQIQFVNNCNCLLIWREFPAFRFNWKLLQNCKRKIRRT
jgi:hypothetical protein